MSGHMGGGHMLDAHEMGAMQDRETSMMREMDNFEHHCIGKDADEPSCDAVRSGHLDRMMDLLDAHMGQCESAMGDHHGAMKDQECHMGECDDGDDDDSDGCPMGECDGDDDDDSDECHMGECDDDDDDSDGCHMGECDGDDDDSDECHMGECDDGDDDDSDDCHMNGMGDMGGMDYCCENGSDDGRLGPME